VPLLGNIPGLGLLFQHQNNTVTKKGHVIEVTLHILPEQRQDARASAGRPERES
jgi:type II secretory pathway component GspD/PulD (secretin)